MESKRSMRSAINDFCRGCIYDSLAGGTWRQQVEACTMPDCALYQYRPVSARKSTVKKPMPEGLRRYHQKMKDSQK